MTIKMTTAGEKVSAVEVPTYIVTTGSNQPAKKGIQKWHVFLLVGLIVLVGLILAGALIFVHIFTEAQKDIVKFRLEFKSSSDGKDVKQDVEADPNSNVVQFHVTKDGKDVYVVNDFNRDMQVVKMQMSYGTNCYVSALNRSAALDPSQIDQLNNPDYKNSAGSTLFSVSTSPVSDRSFLPMKAQDMCSGVSVYWAYRSCLNQNQNMNRSDLSERQRRSVYVAPSYNGLGCVNGCCYTVCACYVAVVETADGVCHYYYEFGTCCAIVAQPFCSNVYVAPVHTPGNNCTN